MPGERDRLVADAFHEAAVAGEDVGVMIDDAIAQARVEQALGERHADRVGEALAQRARGRLDAGRMPILRMARGLGAELAEVRELLHRHARIARQMQDRVEQHRAMAGREYETVAVGPAGLGRIELEKAREQHGRHIGHAHGHAGMAGLGLLHRVHGQRADGVRHVLVRHGAVDLLLHRWLSHAAPPRIAIPLRGRALAGSEHRVHRGRPSSRALCSTRWGMADATGCP